MADLSKARCERLAAPSPTIGARWFHAAPGGKERSIGAAAELTSVDYETYLILEEKADRKHEWLDGQIYAMAGGTIEHGQLTTQMVGELGRLASACGCRVFNSDVKIRVQATGLATYPDASVVCGPVERDPGDRNALVNPAVLVEVLFDGTEAYDRCDKFAHYRQVPSPRGDVHVDVDAQRVQRRRPRHHRDGVPEARQRQRHRGVRGALNARGAASNCNGLSRPTAEASAPWRRTAAARAGAATAPSGSSGAPGAPIGVNHLIHGGRGKPRPYAARTLPRRGGACPARGGISG